MPSISLPLIGGVIGAAGSIGGALIGGNAAQSAANTQAGAAEQAAQIQQQEFNTTTKNLAPFLQGGTNTLATLLKQLGIGTNGQLTPGAPLTTPFNASLYHQSPGYQFQLNQGLNAVQNASSATGGINSGNTLKALTQYGQGVANQDYYQGQQVYQGQQNQLFNYLQTLAGSGQNAGAQLGALGNAAAANQGNFVTQAGNALAAGTIGQANALTGGINGVSSNFLLASLLSGGGGGGGSGGVNFNSPDYNSAFG